MARNLFGGTSADVAESVSGARIPGAVGTVWDGPSEGARQITDLTDSSGAPVLQLVADNRGMVPPFYGPPTGSERLWVDFGAGRVGLLATNTGERLVQHQAAADPHQDRAYTNERLLNYVPINGSDLNVPAGSDWARWIVASTADINGSAWKLKTADNTDYTRLRNSGALLIDTIGVRAALCIGAPAYPANQTVVNVTNSKASTTTTASVFRVQGDGSVISAGTVTATNVGSARLFSGPNAPAVPRPGDVWVQYG
ncbi:hypothetical protein P3T27_002120 [Kitasatospora sp. MAA19]|uniref:hypothetical protein n=1 Tax=Kitasatospora sp. MAA19 TaxID=3035090 RepID=UPI0024748D8A|nr:hypothetical protein [Kitasatospora sp. MAA19]MDH6705410.1 hypothetical protein [Kitasatospora sp. MAA19]